MHVQDFNKWYEKETANIIKPLDKEASVLIEDVKKKMAQLQDACRNLIKECEREMEKGKGYHRARVGKRLAQLFLDMLNNISFPEPISYATTEGFVKELRKALSTIERERNIWFQRISPLFIMARRRIDMFLSRFLESTQKLTSFTSERYVKARTVADCLATAGDLIELRGELGEIEKEKHDITLGISSVEKEIVKVKEKILSIREKDEIEELTVINHQAKELEKEVKHELRYLQKPFVKLQNLYHSGDVNIPTEEIEKLNEYLAHPFLALAKEEHGYPVCKRILQKISETIKQDKLRIKSSRQKKAQDQISAILHNDSLIPLQQQSKQLYDRRRQLLARGNIGAFKNEITALRMTLKELERQKEHLNSRFSSLQNHHKEKEIRSESLKKELEKTVLSITKRNINLSF